MNNPKKASISTRIFNFLLLIGSIAFITALLIYPEYKVQLLFGLGYALAVIWAVSEALPFRKKF